MDRVTGDRIADILRERIVKRGERIAFLRERIASFRSPSSLDVPHSGQSQIETAEAKQWTQEQPRSLEKAAEEISAAIPAEKNSKKKWNDIALQAGGGFSPKEYSKHAELKQEKEAEILSQRIEKQKQMQQLAEEMLRALVDKEIPQGVDDARFRAVLLAFQNPNPSSSEAEADPILLLDMKSRGFMHFLTRVEPPLSDGMCVIVKGKNGKPCDVVDVCVVACE